MKKTWILPIGVLGLATAQILTLRGLIRRVEGLESRLQEGLVPEGPLLAIGPGDLLPDLGALGAEPTRPDPAAELPVVYGFFSPHCEACHAQVEPLKSLQAEGAATTRAFVMDDGGDTAHLVALLAPVPVTVATVDGPVFSAFAPSGFPSFVTATAGGVVSAVGYEVPSARSLPKTKETAGLGRPRA